jgi:hypothetical protein
LLGDFLGDFSLSFGDFFTKTSGHPGTSWPQSQIFGELLTKKIQTIFFCQLGFKKQKFIHKISSHHSYRFGVSCCGCYINTLTELIVNMATVSKF